MVLIRKVKKTYPSTQVQLLSFELFDTYCGVF